MHVARRRSGIAALSVLLVLTAAIAVRAAEPTLGPGTYDQYNPGTKKLADPGNQIVIVRGKNGRLAFSLNAVRGSDLNQGYVAGVLPPVTGRSVVWSQKETDANCKLTFTATSGGGVTVVQDASFGDCGFGAGVLADGQYVRSAENAVLGPRNGP